MSTSINVLPYRKSGVYQSGYTPTASQILDSAFTEIRWHHLDNLTVGVLGTGKIRTAIKNMPGCEGDRRLAMRVMNLLKARGYIVCFPKEGQHKNTLFRIASLRNGSLPWNHLKG